MKKSSLLLSAGIALVVLLMLISLFILRFNIGRDLDLTAGPRLEFSGERVSIPVNTEGVSSLQVSGGWELQLSQGTGKRGELSLPVELADTLQQIRKGDTLYLSLAKNFNPGEDMPYRAVLDLENLTMLKVEGAADLKLAGFRTDTLELVFAGASNVNGTGIEAENLKLRTAGASNIDFSGSSFVNADLDLAGASNVELHLAGGILSGKIAGFASVEYSGIISEQTLRTDGFAAVHRR